MVPNSLKIGGLTVVVEQSKMLASSRDKFGEYSFMEQKITIDHLALVAGEMELRSENGGNDKKAAKIC